VSAGGALVGAGYAALVGAAWGAVVAGLWNGAHAVLLALIRIRASLGAYSID
jgi:hypothetical protein